MSTPDPDFLLRLRPLAGYGWSIAPEQRLRGALKVLLRRFGMRCVECKPSTEATGHDGKPRLASSEPSEAE